MSASPDPDALVVRAIVALVRSGAPARFTAFGTSMWPAIRPGARVRVDPATADEVRVGDVVAALAGERLVVHRLVGRSGAELILRGDALAGTERVPRDALLGRAQVEWQRALRPRLPRPAQLPRLLRSALWALRARLT